MAGRGSEQVRDKDRVVRNREKELGLRREEAERISTKSARRGKGIGDKGGKVERQESR